MMALKHRFYNYPVKTKWGVFTLIVSDNGLVSLHFPKRRRLNGSKKIPDSVQKISKQVAGQLKKYIVNGACSLKRICIDRSRWSKTQKKVSVNLQTIPQGETKSYHWLANACGIEKGCRAVGQVLGLNPIPIFIPCHRIIRKDGSLGGFSAGIHWKKKLLLHEQRSKIKN